MRRYYFSDNAPGASIVHEAKGGGGSSLGDVWAAVGRGVACVSILREQADGSLVRIATRGCGGPWVIAR